MQKTWFSLWVGTIPWRREWLPIPVFLPGEFHGQRSLVGYSPWGHRVGHDWGTNTAAANSLQSCPTLCDPTDGSPLGSPVPGILQTRTLEWVAISFSNAWKWKEYSLYKAFCSICSTPFFSSDPEKWLFLINRRISQFKKISSLKSCRWWGKETGDGLMSRGRRSSDFLKSLDVSI